LRIYASSENDQVNAVDIIAAQLVQVCFPCDVQTCCNSLLYIIQTGSAQLRAASFYVAAQLVKASKSCGSFLHAFNDMIRYASNSISSLHCEEISMFLQEASSSAREWALDSTSITVSSSDEGGRPGRAYIADKRTASAGLVCLSADPTAFFAVASPYSSKIMPGFESNEGKRNLTPIESKTRFEARRGSFVSKNIVSPGSRNQEPQRKNSNVIPVPCTLANLIDTA
ncbi:hypothetical protein BVRB_025370, partial [Beta vulgaris subsp. vulgaris]